MAKLPAKTIPIGEWLPDLPALNNPGCPYVMNVQPVTPKSYGPVPAMMTYSSNGLNKACQGATSFIDTGGNVFLFAGDAADLYLLKSGSTAWSAVSKSASPYHCASTDQWKFEYFNGDVIATQFGDNPQVFNLASSSAFADLGGTPPRGRYVAAIRGFLAFANTFDGTFGAQPQRVWWSGFNSDTAWPTPGGAAAAAEQSSYNDLFGGQGWVTGLVGNLGNADGAVFMERGVWRVMYAGPPDVFAFLPAEGAKGCIAPGSILQVGDLAFYLGVDGFYWFDGANSTPIGANKIDRTFFADLDVSNIGKVCAAIDPLARQIWVAYPGQGNSNGIPNKVLIYNYVNQRWTQCTITVEFLARMMSIGYTLDQLFTVLGYTIDNLPAPLDSRVWTGGALNLSAFDTNHKLNNFTGANLAATVDTTEFQVGPGIRGEVTGARPLVDGGVPTIAIGHRERQQDAVAFTPAASMNSLGTANPRTSGRYLRARIGVPAAATWTHLMGAELELAARGGR